MGRIIWLASFPKSGNTWIRAFLHNLHAGSEARLTTSIAWASFPSAIWTIHFYQQHLTKPVAEWTREDVMATRWNAQRDISRMSTDDVFVKTHNAHVEFDGKPMIHMDPDGRRHLHRAQPAGCLHLAGRSLWLLDRRGDPDPGRQHQRHADRRPAGVREMHRTWSVHVVQLDQGAQGPGCMWCATRTC